MGILNLFKHKRPEPNINDLVLSLFEHNIYNWNFVNKNIVAKNEWSIKLTNNFDFEHNLIGVELYKFRKTLRDGLAKIAIQRNYTIVKETDTEMIIW